MSGKGSKPRPVKKATYDRNYAAIAWKSNRKDKPKPKKISYSAFCA